MEQQSHKCPNSSSKCMVGSRREGRVLSSRQSVVEHARMEAWQELGGKINSVHLRSVHRAFDICAIFWDHGTGGESGLRRSHKSRTTLVESGIPAPGGRGGRSGGVLMGAGAWESEVAPFARHRIRSGEVHVWSRDATLWPDDKRVLKGKGMAHRKMTWTPPLRSPVGVRGIFL